MAEIYSQYPAMQGNVQPITDRGIFRIQAIRGATLPAELTADTVRNIVLEVVAMTEATRPNTFRTTRPYDRSGQRTRKPRHASWSN